MVFNIFDAVFRTRESVRKCISPSKALWLPSIRIFIWSREARENRRTPGETTLARAVQLRKIKKGNDSFKINYSTYYSDMIRRPIDQIKNGPVRKY